MILFILNFILPLIAIAASFIGHIPSRRILITLASGLLVTNNIAILNLGDTQTIVLADILSGYQIALTHNILSSIFAIMVTSLYFITNLYSFFFWDIQETSELHKDLNPKIHFFFTPIAILATLGIGYSSNLITLFIFYEILTFSTYPLVIQSFSDHARKAGRIYLGILFSSSTLFLLFALIFLDKYYGSSNFNVNGIFDEQTAIKDIVILLICFIFGFSKTAIFPLHKWLPHAMVAPVPVSALLHAVAVVKSGIFALIKVFIFLFGMDYLSNLHNSIPWSIDWITLLGCFTMLYAGIIACRQTNLKKILAYSTISQLSYMIVFLSFTTYSTLTLTVLQMLTHSIAKITLFFSVGIINLASHKSDVEEMRGISRILPIPVMLFILGAFSIIGLPPSIGWIVKNLTFQIITCDTLIGSIVISSLIISSLMACYYFFRPIYLMLCPPEEKQYIFAKTGYLSMVTSTAFATSLVLLFYIEDIMHIISIFLEK